MVLGIDIGASKINIVVWNGKKIVDKWLSEEATKEKLKQGVGQFDIKKIGIGVPGIVKDSKIIKCPNLSGLNGLDLRKLLKKDVRLDNDANCFLRAEAKLGAAQRYKNVLAITLGTGIGGSIMINGKIYYGANNSAGEIGHMIIKDSKFRTQNLKLQLKTQNCFTWEQFYQASKNDSKKQSKVLSIGLANLINILDPEIIVIGGGAAQMPKDFRKYIISPLSKKTPIVFSKLGLDAGAIGAALLFEE